MKRNCKKIIRYEVRYLLNVDLECQFDYGKMQQSEYLY